MDSPKSDFRQWLVYNGLLKSDHHLYALYKTLEQGVSRDTFTFDKVMDQASELYQLTQKGHGIPLVLTGAERTEMLRYLKTHYILGDDVEKWISQANERAAARVEKSQEEVPYFLDPRYNTSLPRVHSNPSSQPVEMDQPRPAVKRNPSAWFYNPIVKKHVLGYACVGLVIAQMFMIPTNVFHVKLPEVFRYGYSLAFFVILHLAVRNYRNQYLGGGMGYDTVIAITFWLFLIMFGVMSFEISVIDAVSDAEFSLFKFFIMPIILLPAGLFMGWFFSLFVYLINRGSGARKPSTAKATR
jgi:hypothetical protein